MNRQFNIVNCPHCKREVYANKPNCSHCGLSLSKKELCECDYHKDKIKEEFDKDYFKLKTFMRMMSERYNNKTSHLGQEQKRVLLQVNIQCEDM